MTTHKIKNHTVGSKMQQLIKSIIESENGIIGLIISLIDESIEQHKKVLHLFGAYCRINPQLVKQK